MFTFLTEKEREREREIVCRRQSSIASIIFSFFEIKLSFLCFFVVVVAKQDGERGGLEKKNLTFEKKNRRKSSALFPFASSPIPPPITLPNSIIGTKTAANQSRPKEELALFLLKNDERNVNLSFSDGFLERNSRKDEKDARARKMISKPRIINFNGKIIDKNKIIISLTVFRRYQQKPICSCACGVRRSRLENNRRISFL